MRDRAKEALDYIKEENYPPVSRYVKLGFYGIYKLVAEKDSEGALKDLQEAAKYSAENGNRFAVADCLFMCCRAVAAERDKRYREPEVNHYLKEAGRYFYTSPVYRNLYNIARSEISRIGEEKGQARNR